VRGVRWQHQPVSRAEINIAAAGVEHDAPAHARQHFFIAVFVPAIGVAWGIAASVRGLGRQRALAQMISFSPGGGPSCLSTTILIV
jgi:hypothetical protein